MNQDDILAISLEDDVYGDYYYDWYVNDMFPENDKDVSKEEFIAKICNDCAGPGSDLKWLFDTSKIRVRLKGTMVGSP